MLAAVKNSVARQIKGTLLEPLARAVWELFNPPSSKDAYIKQAPAYISQIISRILTKNSNCIDVGCHKGDILTQMLRFAPLGHHYAFEPIPGLAEKVEQKFPEVELRQVALSSLEGEVEFHHVTSRPSYSGLRLRPLPSSNEMVEVIKVKTQKLDDVLPPGLKIHFIKIDVEGAELEVFKGAIQTLKTHKPYILFEHGPLSSKCYGSTPDRIYELLVYECGLRIFRLRDWLENSGSLSQNEFSSIQGVEWDFLATP